jgi:hypothetical protein
VGLRVDFQSLSSARSSSSASESSREARAALACTCRTCPGGTRKKGKEGERKKSGASRSGEKSGSVDVAACQAEQRCGYCIDCGACARRMPALDHPSGTAKFGHEPHAHARAPYAAMHCMLSHPAAGRRCWSVSVCLLGSVHPLAENIDGLRECCCRGAPVYVALGAPHAADFRLLVAAPHRSHTLVKAQARGGGRSNARQMPSRTRAVTQRAMQRGRRRAAPAHHCASAPPADGAGGAALTC